MDATATRAWTKAALAVLAGGLLALAVAAPARAQEPAATGEQPPPSEEPSSSAEQPPAPEEPGSAPQQADTAQEKPTAPGEEPAAPGEEEPAAPGDDAWFENGPAPELSGTAAPLESEQPAAESLEPSGEPEGPAGEPHGALQAPDAPSGVQSEPQPAVEPPPSEGGLEPPPEPGAESRAYDRLERLLVKAHRRLDAVERGVRRVRRQVDQGARPRPEQLDDLRGNVQQLRVVLGQLRHESASAPAPIAGLDVMEARLGRLRKAAAALVAALTAHEDRSPEANALIDQLLALEGRPASGAPAGGAGRRAIHNRSRSAPRGLGPAYTQPYALRAQPVSGPAPLTRQPPGGAEAPASPGRSPGGPPAPSGSATAAPSASFFSVAGPAALALLLGLAIPRVVRRLVALPVRRPPEPFASPPERPG
jgi:hypothetical protein